MEGLCPAGPAKMGRAGPKICQLRKLVAEVQFSPPYSLYYTMCMYIYIHCKNKIIYNFVSWHR